MLDRRASSSHRDQGPLNRLRLGLSLATLLGWTVWTTPARAATVAILWPPAPCADVTQALTLLRGELLSVGLEVTESDQAAARARGGADSVSWLEAFAAQGAVAVVETIGTGALEGLDVWVVKARPQRFEVTRVAIEPDAPRQPEMLALRAVEALRAGLLQSDWAARKRHQEPIAKPPTVAAPTGAGQQAASHDERVGIEVGAAAIMSLDGLGPAVLSTARVGWAVRPWLVMQASVAGIGSWSTVTTAAGDARVAQQYAVIGGICRLRSTERLWPFLGLAAGALRTSVEGQTGWSTGGGTPERWSGVVDVSLGAGIRLYGRLYVSFAAHVQVAEPYVAVHIADTVGATSGRPNLLLTLTVGAWL